MIWLTASQGYEEPVKWEILTESIYFQSLNQASANDIYRYI